MHSSRAKVVVAPRLGDGWQDMLQIHAQNPGVDVDVSCTGCKHLLSSQYHFNMLAWSSQSIRQTSYRMTRFH